MSELFWFNKTTVIVNLGAKYTGRVNINTFPCSTTGTENCQFYTSEPSDVCFNPWKLSPSELRDQRLNA